jgi:hypothetical protein
MNNLIQIDISTLTKNERDKLYYLLYDSKVESEINQKAIKDISTYIQPSKQISDFKSELNSSNGY